MTISNQMQLNKFYSTLYEIPRAPFYDKFNFYFHGGILNWGENTTDIDVKLTPRIEPVTCNQIEETLYDLKRLEVAGIFFKKIHTWNEKLRPNFEQIENSEAVLQAVIDRDKEKLEKGQVNIDRKYIYRGKVKYYKVRGLLFCKSPEWAVCGYKYNEGYKDPLATAPLPHSAPVEIREMLEFPRCKDWLEFKNRFQRLYG